MVEHGKNECDICTILLKVTNKDLNVKSYLDACGVPTAKVGTIEAPRLMMGVHPFDGCSYQDHEKDAENLRTFGSVADVTKSLCYAVKEEGITVTQIDHMSPNLHRLHLQAIWETERLIDTQIGLLAYFLIPITLNGELVSYSPRARSTLYARNEAVGGESFYSQLKRDEILRYTLGGSMNNLMTPAKAPPFSKQDAAKLSIDYSKFEQYLGFYAGCDILIADPGAEIDLLAVTGRIDLIREYIGFLRSRFKTVITSVHHAGLTIQILETEGIQVDGYMTPINEPGMYMFPTQELALDAITQANKPVFSIKPLAGGRYIDPKAFEYVFDDAGADFCMYGMGTVNQIRQTTLAAKKALGVAI